MVFISALSDVFRCFFRFFLILSGPGLAGSTLLLFRTHFISFIYVSYIILLTQACLFSLLFSSCSFSSLLHPFHIFPFVIFCYSSFSQVFMDLNIPIFYVYVHQHLLILLELHSLFVLGYSFHSHGDPLIIG